MLRASCSPVILTGQLTEQRVQWSALGCMGHSGGPAPSTRGLNECELKLKLIVSTRTTAPRKYFFETLDTIASFI